MKQQLDRYCLSENSTIKDALKIIDKNLIGAAFVIKTNEKVVGVITDGDIRRAFINGMNLDNKIDEIFNKDFKFVNNVYNKDKTKEFMLKNKIRQLPVLDENNKLIDICLLEDLMKYEEKDNYVFILAGGLGTRLRPLTNDIPKPMLKVGDKPILELIINQFKEFGFKNFIISINYKGEIIEEYFKDGKNFDVNIEYVREKKKLGTAGSIKLAESKFTKPFIVINGDILTGMNFDSFLNYHINNKFDITVGVRNYEMKIPYGVMVTEDLEIRSIEEKPTYNFYINSGIYVLDEKVLKYIPKDESCNMPDVINKIINQKGKSAVYSITEYWTDIGRVDDYYKANEDVKIYFNR